MCESISIFVNDENKAYFLIQVSRMLGSGFIQNCHWPDIPRPRAQNFLFISKTCKISLGSLARGVRVSQEESIGRLSILITYKFLVFYKFIGDADGVGKALLGSSTAAEPFYHYHFQLVLLLDVFLVLESSIEFCNKGDPLHIAHAS